MARTSRPTTRQALLCLACALLSIAISVMEPRTASAAQAFMRPTTAVPRDFPLLYDMIYQADPGETNDVTVSRDPVGVYDIEDRGAVIRPGAYCAALSPNHVVCTPVDLGARFNIYGAFLLLDGNDRITLTALPGKP